MTYVIALVFVNCTLPIVNPLPVMRNHPALPSRYLRLASLLLSLSLVFAVGCGGAADTPGTSTEDVDETTPVEVTDEERSAFRAPADSVLSDEQVTMFLNASLLQFDLIREHSAALHDRLAKMEKRSEEGGAFAGLRNLMDAGRTAAEFADVFGGSYIRASRTLGYNPAELEWVREQLAETASYFAFAPVGASLDQSLQEARASLAAMQAELEEAEVEDESGMADLLSDMESDQTWAEMMPQGAVARNMEIIRRTRPEVTDPMWAAIGFSAGTLGFVGLSDPNDPEVQEKLDEFRQLFTDALANRVSPGMESE